MQYINSGERRLLVCIRMMKKWVAPSQVVNLSPIDIRMLGANGVYMRPATEEERATSRVSDTTPMKQANVPTTPSKPAAKKPDEKASRKALKEALEEYTKSGLTDIANLFGAELKSKDNKAAIEKKIMAAAKKMGYAEALKKVD